MAKVRRKMGKVEKTRINPSDKSGKRKREREKQEKRHEENTRIVARKQSTGVIKIAPV